MPAPYSTANLLKTACPSMPSLRLMFRPCVSTVRLDANARIGFLAHARTYAAALDRGALLAPAKSLAQMRQIIFNDYLDASLAGFFMLVVLSVLFFGARTVLAARAQAAPSARESAFQATPAAP
ncbi:hypothetical protein ACFDR9_003026 [Janthinobacterium sp. CG_23.3]